ncbi:ATP-binding protein [Candidatus Nitrosocosmicus hydrocola]|uniref:ATP-binding protein n=1 Tax=Candidatus Nitrosocosmicus hydrocola TaxID=1826872 RepID=UPI0011E5CA4F|nr:ATP-binding protein [Candidatus Nitrosocosmicus hydrocola]
MELKVHPSFFREFATKTWISPYEIVRELIENAFDEDATNVIVTLLNNGNIIIEDNAGMNSDSMDKFLILGSPHKAEETLSPNLKRLRTGRYGTGRLSFLTSFDQMKIKTRRDGFSKSIVIDGNTLEELINGRAKLSELKEPKLNRNGTEILLKGSKISVDINKLAKEIKKLSILKYPLFDVYIKSAEDFREWDLTNSQVIRSPDIQGYKLNVSLDNPQVTGEIVIARRPLGADEKGIAIMVGNHVVLRSTFGFENKLSRVTGYVKCDALTSRFADKSALIENDIYNNFNQNVKTFIVDQVLPSLTEYEDVLITREESKIYKEIDKVMGQAVLETLEPGEEIQGFESVEITSHQLEDGGLGGGGGGETNSLNDADLPRENRNDFSSGDSDRDYHTGLKEGEDKKTSQFDIENASKSNSSIHPTLASQSMANTDPNNSRNEEKWNSQNGNKYPNTSYVDQDSINYDSQFPSAVGASGAAYEGNLIKKTVRKPILKKTFTLKKIGYKVVPYEDETDPRYSFTNENIVFVNKAHSTYKVEAERGDEFLFRHITNIVAEVVVGSKYPEAKDILEIQNKLISEAIKIHDYSMLKK